MGSQINVALCQQAVELTFEKNVENAISQVNIAATKGANLIVLPEIFVCPYDVDLFPNVAINDNHSFIDQFKDLSQKTKSVIVAGSVVEKENNNLYNTSYIFDQGKLVGKHRKAHLFDIDIPGKITFKESEVFGTSSEITVLDTSLGKIGVAICFDLRFPEQYKLMALKGAKIIVTPAAFNTVTGPLHWELVTRSRAVDSQCYLLVCSPSLNESYKYLAYGHSAIIDPSGKVIKMLEFEPGMILESIDLDFVDQCRKEIPVLEKTQFI